MTLETAKPVNHPKTAADHIAAACVRGTCQQSWALITLLVLGKSCEFCGFTWEERSDIILRNPILADGSAQRFACHKCWNKGQRLPA